MKSSNGNLVCALLRKVMCFFISRMQDYIGCSSQWHRRNAVKRNSISYNATAFSLRFLWTGEQNIYKSKKFSNCVISFVFRAASRDTIPGAFLPEQQEQATKKKMRSAYLRGLNRIQPWGLAGAARGTSRIVTRGPSRVLTARLN